MEKIKSFFQRGDNADQQPAEQPATSSASLLQSMDESTTLSWKQRATGFGICFGLGILISAISIPTLWSLSFTKFAILWALGSLLSMGSTMFLMGPLKQLKAMFASHRLLATCVYLASTILTLFLAFKFQNPGLCLIMLAVQIAALIWYCATWIPGGQTYLKGFVMRSTT
ncbi:tetraspanning membrane protein [Dunaliella salina]|uniref:Vesicle transport protein n=1 Tax=Dunaliella salina TaxID=3046 RepID=A0ABQ7G0L5_DUNSA|nr:tetraspanning membrane protein [Dunaliella salina]|eukprot:KAF5828145.1 tetraspanning membrane protein [Dunaliella salina]